MPSKAELFRVKSGDHIKLIFQVGDDIAERMWVEVKECHDMNWWTGILDNQPIGERNARILKPGKLIKFHPYDIIDIMTDEMEFEQMMSRLISEGIKSSKTSEISWYRNPQVIIPGIVVPLAIAIIGWIWFSQ